MATLPIISVDQWELRCHYKKARYPQRILNNEFNEKRTDRPKSANPKYNLGPGGISVEVYYYDKITNEQVLEVHRLEKADGTLGRHGLLRRRRKPDPKMVLHNGIIYKRRGGIDPIVREPELRYRWIWQRKL